MKKLVFLILFINLYASCDIFTDVLQTRNKQSHIRMDGYGYIYNSPSCNLNTGYIQADNSHRLVCNNSIDAKASGNYGKRLNIDYNFNIESSNVLKTTAKGNDVYIISNNQVLSNSDYNKILENSQNYSFSLNYNGDKKINEINNLSNILTFKNNENHNIYIGYIITKDSNLLTNINFTTIPNNIYIYELYNGGGNKLTSDLNATQSVKINNLKLNSSSNTNITISAPKVVIDNLLSTNDNNTIIIYADYIDITKIQLAQHSKLIIHPYTTGNKVVFHSDTIISSSSSTIILDSGEYYTNSLSIPGSSDVSSIRIANNNQIVNFYINGDFTPGNNPGINSDGNNGNFGSLTPANFRLFINGDLSTGGGGTTFNAVVYVEGDVTLGSPTYIKGGISANNEIIVKNNSKFYYDSSINSSIVDDLCKVNAPQFENLYSCDIFPSVLTSKNINANGNEIFNTCSVATDNLNGDFNCDDCNGNCSIVPFLSNKYSHTFINSSDNTSKTVSDDVVFNNLEYGNLIFNNDNQNITFAPDNNYSNKDIAVMLAKDVDFTANNQTLILESGDYYFNSLNINDTDFNFCANGDVRIFIKNDFNYNANSLNNNCNGNIFMFVEGDANINTMNSERGDINLTLYTKGNVNINDNSDIRWNGSITSESNININGNGIKFYYNPYVLDSFGVGECGLCYDSNYVAKNGFSMFGLTLCSSNTPCILDMPIKNTTNNNLDNVKVIETYKSNFSFASTFLGFNSLDTVDKNNNHIGNGAYKENSADYSMFNLFNLSLNNSAIIYDFGDNYPKYSNNKNYYKAYKKSTSSVKLNISKEGLFNQWKDNVVYLAEYLNNGKLYKVKLSSCPVEPNPSIINGNFGAWDVYRNENDQNISTKIVNNPFYLEIKFLSKLHLTDKFNIKYYLFDANNNKTITSLNDFFINYTHKVIKPVFEINKAYKNVKVGFKVCADYSLGEFNYKPFSDCIENCSSNDEENNVCFRYFESRDAFAIRPNIFSIDNIPSYVRADNNISLSIKAIDYLDKNTKEYNQISNNLKMVVTDLKSCSISSFNYDINFYDGIAKINYLKYPEVGKLNVKVIDNNFANIDNDDTDYDDRVIKGDFNITVIPDHFNISINNVGNYKGGSFTYLSNNLNMSGEMNATIMAVNKNNVATRNYTSNCYAKKIEINISHDSNTSMQNLNKIITQYSNNDKDKNISFVLDENNFTNGVLTLNLKINFDRNISNPTNPFILTLNDMFVIDDNKTYGFSNVSDKIKYIYGKIIVKDKTTILNDANISLVFDKYDNLWLKNINHMNEGEVYNMFTKQLANIVLYKAQNGEQNITISPSITSRPYKVRLHLFIPSWLWYSKGGVAYKSPSNDNTDCTTHPCINVLFLPQSSKSWAGAGTNETENNVSKQSIGIDVNGIKDRSYHKINW